MKKIAALVAAVALMATSAASMGCFWYLLDEPKCLDSFED